LTLQRQGRAELIDLRTLAQAAVTTFSRQESALGSLMLWNTSRAA
jgi:hypothetical protein